MPNSWDLFLPTGKLKDWWDTISSEEATGQDKADRAILKRAHDLTTLVCTSSYQRIYRVLAEVHDEPFEHFQQDRIAAVVGLAAHIKEDAELSIPQSMSNRGEGSERNPVSDLRFLSLLKSPDINTLFINLRRCLPLIDGKTNVLRIAKDVFYWDDKVKKRWAYDYRWTEQSAD